MQNGLVGDVLDIDTESGTSRLWESLPRRGDPLNRFPTYLLDTF